MERDSRPGHDYANQEPRREEQERVLVKPEPT